MYVQNEALSNVAPGAIASCKVGRGAYLLRLVLECSGAAFDISAHIEWVKVLLNEKEIIPEITGAQLEKLNAGKGLFVDESALVVSFIDEAALNAGSLYLGGIDTAAGVSTFIFQVKLAAGAPADTALKLWRDEMPAFRNPDGSLRGLQEFKALRKFTVPVTAADLYTITPDVGPLKNGEALQRLHVLGANVDSVGIRKNGLPVHDDVPAALNARDLKDYGLVPQADLYTVDLVKRGDNGELVDKGASATSLEYRFKTTGAGNLTVFEERLTRIGLI